MSRLQKPWPVRTTASNATALKRTKTGPAYKKVAEKYRGKANAEEKLVNHLTSGEKVKFSDGHEEEHKVIKTRDMGEIKNLVDWILSL